MRYHNRRETNFEQTREAGEKQTKYNGVISLFEHILLLFTLSFSMYLRYSSIVVAPMHRSCPRASAGLRRLDASMLPPDVAPAPTTVCIWGQV